MQEAARISVEKECLDCISDAIPTHSSGWRMRLKQSRFSALAKRLHNRLHQAGRKIAGTDKKIIRDYLAQHPVKKLHLGCGAHALPGWLNSDLHPMSPQIIAVDVTRTFPVASASFDYVYSEHMIEHLPYAQGQYMLREAFRVLKVGGKIRVSTPDLQFLIDMYRSRKSELQQRYIAWATERFIPDAPHYADTFVINNFMRDWGHVFIYDEKTLRMALERAGFSNITRCEVNRSADEHLCNLENEHRMPSGFVQLETFTLEATKTAWSCVTGSGGAIAPLQEAIAAESHDLRDVA